MSYESTRDESIGNAENSVAAPRKRSCNCLQTACKRSRPRGTRWRRQRKVEGGKPIAADGPPLHHARGDTRRSLGYAERARSR
jgi:hypothetical protein